MTFDLTKLDAKTRSDAGVAMTVINPATALPLRDDAGKPVTITLKGKSSAAYKTIWRVILDRNRDRSAKGITPNEEEVRQDDIDLLTALTAAWDFTDLDGAPFPCTPENARRMWSDERFSWVMQQAMRFASNDGNFLAI